MCMGLWPSPYIFTKMSNFIMRCCELSGVKGVINYLDDFAVSGHDWQQCAAAQPTIIRVLCFMGFFKINFPKVISP